MRKSLALIIVTVLLVGCTMPKTRIYSINLPSGRDAQLSEARASLTLRVESPRYLAQPYIASRKSPYEIEISKYSKWEATPRDIVLDALKSSLASTGLFTEIRTSNIVPPDYYSLEVELKRFEAVDEGDASFGEVVIQANFSAPRGRNLSRSTVTKRTKLDGSDFLNLAKGLSTVLSEGVEEVTLHVSDALKEQRAAGVHH